MFKNSTAKIEHYCLLHKFTAQAFFLVAQGKQKQTPLKCGALLL